MTESVIYCEGYHDRAFWAGWLQRLGCADQSQGGKVKTILDPWKIQVRGGQYAYWTRSRGFLRIQPCNGDDGVWRALSGRLSDRTTKACARLVVSVDLDRDPRASPDEALARLRQGLVSRVRAADPSFVQLDEDTCTVDQGATLISLITWRTSDPPHAELPEARTLERLVVASLRAAYPERATAVSAWLRSRPAATAAGTDDLTEYWDAFQGRPAAAATGMEGQAEVQPQRTGAPIAGPKAHAWSHMAGWYEEAGCDAFYKVLWEDECIASELQARLLASGAWAIANAVVA